MKFRLLNKEGKPTIITIGDSLKVILRWSIGR